MYTASNAIYCYVVMNNVYENVESMSFSKLSRAELHFALFLLSIFIAEQIMKTLWRRNED